MSSLAPESAAVKRQFVGSDADPHGSLAPASGAADQTREVPAEQRRGDDPRCGPDEKARMALVKASGARSDLAAARLQALLAEAG